MGRYENTDNDNVTFINPVLHPGYYSDYIYFLKL